MLADVIDGLMAVETKLLADGLADSSSVNRTRKTIVHGDVGSSPLLFLNTITSFFVSSQKKKGLRVIITSVARDQVFAALSF